MAKFDKFCLDKFARPSEQIIIDIKDGRLDPYRTLDNFVGYMDKTNINPNSMSVYISWVKGYMVYSDIDLSPYKFKQRVILPTKRIVRDAELNREQINRILSILPLRLRIFCMLVMTTLRRPHEISNLRVRDINFDTNPATVIIPANLSKNRVEGTTFTTKETAGLIKDHIKRNRLDIDDYIFSNAYESNKPTQQVDSLFRYHIRNYPDLNIKLVGSNRYAIHIYSFKKFGYTRVDRKFGKNFTDGLKGDKGSEYHRLPIEEKKTMYLELEPELTIFNMEGIKRELESKYSNQTKEIEELKTRLDDMECKKEYFGMALFDEILHKDVGSTGKFEELFSAAKEKAERMWKKYPGMDMNKAGYGIKQVSKKKD